MIFWAEFRYDSLHGPLRAGEPGTSDDGETCWRRNRVIHWLRLDAHRLPSIDRRSHVGQLSNWGTHGGSNHRVGEMQTSVVVDKC